MSGKETAEALTMVQAFFEYHPSGRLFWKVRRPGVKIGMQAGRVANNGYRSITEKHFLAHRIVWAIHNGAWPSGPLDHINGCRDDNRIENLRLVTHSGNQQNRRRHREGNFVGVYYVKLEKKWKAQAPKNYLGTTGPRKHIGTFLTPESAHKAVVEFCRKRGRE